MCSFSKEKEQFQEMVWLDFNNYEYLVNSSEHVPEQRDSLSVCLNKEILYKKTRFIL